MFISIITHIVTNQKYFKPLFLLIRSSTKIIELDHAKIPVSITSEDGVAREFLETDSNSMFSKS